MPSDLNDNISTSTTADEPGKDFAGVSANDKPHSLAAQLPIEIIQSIYQCLRPVDLDAARHTCRKWLAASLDLTILSEQTKRGGWWSIVVADGDQRLGIQIKFLSRLIVRECALSARSYCPFMRSNHQATLEGFEEKDATASIEMPLTFATTLCGMYCGVSKGPRIMIYYLDHHTLQPLWTVLCETDVLKLSIQSRPGRAPILAALLADRLGVFVDFDKPGSVFKAAANDQLRSEDPIPDVDLAR
ncbi:hypothetical protein LTR62_008654 [Meristemomyces frigidus]|uniref:F-box domain-containing protein n=1 Tax=Meristemomyces frigidus TaxID=1508187 RepID=A0AAN7YCM7_9PEZI|nr:hypothetical protein LTR62_008654 [Meristemomyces frigidus]